MKHVVMLMASILFTGIVFAQEQTIEQGAVLTLGETSASGYHHIDFPRKNHIIKRGAIANFNSLEGAKVVVTKVYDKNGSTQVELQRTDGSKFFRFWPSVTANLDKALLNGELKKPASLQKNALAQN